MPTLSNDVRSDENPEAGRCATELVAGEADADVGWDAVACGRIPGTVLNGAARTDKTVVSGGALDAVGDGTVA